MADPISILGTTVGVISLGIQVTQSLVGFYKASKNRDSDLAGITGKLEGLEEIFQYLDKALSSRKFQAHEAGLAENVEKSIVNCTGLIQELQDVCQQFNKASAEGFRATAQVLGRRATYPFRQSTLQKLREDIAEIRANISFALEVLKFNDSLEVRENVTDIKAILESVQKFQISSDLRSWLRAPDSFIDHNECCEKKHPGTGTWLVRGSQFSRWLVQEKSFIWIRGFAGSGKSVLCSTAIQAVLRHRGSDNKIGVAFFYFSFNDTSKQDESSMLRALILQFSSQLGDGHADLEQLHELYENGMPPSRVLLDYLLRLVQRFQHSYILIDALDESPHNGPRGRVLDSLDTMRLWGVPNLHVLATSRNELDIRECLDLPAVQQVMMSNVGIDEDIMDFISGQLKEDRRFRRLLPYHDKIRQALSNGARGVFRWVECQLQSLQSCPRSEYHLDKVLHSLPQSLDETYERILCKIDEHLIEDVRRILTLLCFVRRPLKVRELIDAVAVDLGDSPGLNKSRRLQDSDDVHDLCAGLVDIILDADLTSKDKTLHGQSELDAEYRMEYNSQPLVRIAHFSVQEYLVSKRVVDGKAAMFSLKSAPAHVEIGQICLVYLLEDEICNSNDRRRLLTTFPFARFAAEYWHFHYIKVVDPDFKLNPLLLKLFQSRQSLTTCMSIHDLDSRAIDTRKHWVIPSPIYYASLLGFRNILVHLIEALRKENMMSEINAQGGAHNNALQAASARGHRDIVQILCDNGANVNAVARNTYDHTALSAASGEGHEDIVHTLIGRGAAVNLPGTWGHSALGAATHSGHSTIVQLLIDHGADVNADLDLLASASLRGDKEIVELLLNHGADANATRGASALEIASAFGYTEIVKLLVENGADVSARVAGSDIAALETASCYDHEEIVDLLLANGAKWAPGWPKSKPLQDQKISAYMHERSIQWLI